MGAPLYQLGPFQFTRQAGAPQIVDFRDPHRWVEQERIGRKSAQQYMGPGCDEIVFDGVLVPGYSGRQRTVDQFRQMADSGKPQMLVDGAGKVYGLFCIRNLREGKEIFMEGGLARRIGFTIELVEYGPDDPGAKGSPLSMTPGAAALGFGAGGAGGVGGLLTQFANMPVLPTTLPGLDAGAWNPATPFQLTEWAVAPANAAAAAAAATSGFNFGQLGSIIQSIGSGDYVGAALGAFGMAGLTVDQSSTWGQLGASAAQMVQQFANGNGPSVMSVALPLLRAATGGQLSALAGAAPSVEGALGAMARNAGTLGEILNVDPKVTSTVRDLILD